MREETLLLLTFVSFLPCSLRILVASLSPVCLGLFANPCPVAVHCVVSSIVAIGGSCHLVSNRIMFLSGSFYPLVTCGEVSPVEIWAALVLVVAHRLEIRTGNVRIILRLHVLCPTHPLSPVSRIFEWVT